MLFLLIGVRGILPLCVFSADASSASKQDPIVCQTATFIDNAGYQGQRIAPRFDVSSFVTPTVSANGGTHVDGDGNTVFSNYVTLTLTLNFDPNTKVIGNTDVKVSNDTFAWNEMNRKNNNQYDDSATATEKAISYGAICALRTDNVGGRETYTPIFSGGNNRLELPTFRVDGNYTVFIFFETREENGTCQNHVVSLSFRVRSCVYLLDETTGFQIKNSGISGAAVLLDTQSRQGVSVEVKKNKETIGKFVGKALDGNLRFAEDGTYQFIVRNKGFVCEVFYFIIDSEAEDGKVLFDNLCRRLGSYQVNGRKIYSYEAEKYFSFTWDESDPNPPLRAEFALIADSEKDPDFSSYQKGTRIETPGFYVVKVYFKTATVTYHIMVIDENAPSYNYERLTANRFNTFKTKWWQVQNDETGQILCFDYGTERDRAYNAAMTIANRTVLDGTGRYRFGGEWYPDRIELTAAMNKHVFANNLKTVYYDPADYAENEESLRSFSSQAFEDCIYLNDDFQFVSLHPAEVASVKAVAKNGCEYPIDFSIPISEQKTPLPNGEYVVIETDKFGNETRYVAFRDKSAPTVCIQSNRGKTTLSNDTHLVVSSFSVESFADAFDGWSVLKIEHQDNKYYFIKEEYKGITFQSKGKYQVSAYDRNGNTLTCSIEIK